jgi:hypothetical protein
MRWDSETSSEWRFIGASLRGWGTKPWQSVCIPNSSSLRGRYDRSKLTLNNGLLHCASLHSQWRCDEGGCGNLTLKDRLLHSATLHSQWRPEWTIMLNSASLRGWGTKPWQSVCIPNSSSWRGRYDRSKLTINDRLLHSLRSFAMTTNDHQRVIASPTKEDVAIPSNSRLLHCIRNDAAIRLPSLSSFCQAILPELSSYIHMEFSGEKK